MIRSDDSMNSNTGQPCYHNRSLLRARLGMRPNGSVRKRAQNLRTIGSAEVYEENAFIIAVAEPASAPQI